MVFDELEYSRDSGEKPDAPSRPTLLMPSNGFAELQRSSFGDL
jgi:hypothetical protein